MKAQVNDFSRPWDGESKNPIICFFQAIGAVIILLIMAIIFIAFVIALAAILFVTALPLHFILKVCGRKGFYVKGEGVSLTAEAFEKA